MGDSNPKPSECNSDALPNWANRPYLRKSSLNIYKNQTLVDPDEYDI